MQHSFWHFFSPKFSGSSFFSVHFAIAIPPLSDTSVLEASGLSLELSSIFILHPFPIWCHYLQSDNLCDNLHRVIIYRVYISWLNLCIQHCNFCIQCLRSPLAQRHGFRSKLWCPCESVLSPASITYKVISICLLVYEKMIFKTWVPSPFALSDNQHLAMLPAFITRKIYPKSILCSASLQPRICLIPTLFHPTWFLESSLVHHKHSIQKNPQPSKI